MKPYPWTEYSSLLKERILNPRNVGSFTENTGALQQMRVIKGKGEEEEALIIFSIVIDETDGIIADAKFIAFGNTTLIGAADAACEILLRKNYDQARRLNKDLIDRKLRDFAQIPAFPKTSYSELNLVLSAIENAAEQCTDIPLKDPIASPLTPNDHSHEKGDSNWHLLSPDEKLCAIKEIIRDEIQPYIELDAGGIEVIALKEEKKVMIAYQGACTSCPSSTGATLEAIQQILRTRLSPSLEVKPDLSFLQY